jgi:hypothetical protein
MIHSRQRCRLFGEYRGGGQKRRTKEKPAVLAGFPEDVPKMRSFLFLIAGMTLLSTAAALLPGLVGHLIGLAGFPLLWLSLLGLILLIGLTVLLCHHNSPLSAGAFF